MLGYHLTGFLVTKYEDTHWKDLECIYIYIYNDTVGEEFWRNNPWTDGGWYAWTNHQYFIGGWIINLNGVHGLRSHELDVYFMENSIEIWMRTGDSIPFFFQDTSFFCLLKGLFLQAAHERIPIDRPIGPKGVKPAKLGILVPNMPWLSPKCRWVEAAGWCWLSGKSWVSPVSPESFP